MRKEWAGRKRLHLYRYIKMIAGKAAKTSYLLACLKLGATIFRPAEHAAEFIHRLKFRGPPHIIFNCRLGFLLNLAILFTYEYPSASSHRWAIGGTALLGVQDA